MKKILALLLVAAMVFALAACQKPGDNPKPADPTEQAQPANTEEGTEPTEVTEPTEEAVVITPPPRPETYVRAADEDIYYSVLEDYSAMMEKAHAAATPDEAFVLYAQAEANLLASGVMIPTTTQGGAYQISRIAYRSTPYVNWGNDDDRWHSIVISDEFITIEERNEMKEMWKAAKAGEGTYDPAAYLQSKGHTIQTEYTTTFATAPKTIDWLNTSSQSDTEITVNTVEGLVEYDNLGNMQPALAESWEKSEDGLTYTFHLRKGVKWFTSEGKEVAEVTAKDFVAGFHHMLDAQAGLESLVWGIIEGTKEYNNDGASFDGVGYKAVDDYTLEMTLCQPTTYFMTMLTYSIFLPICESFYESHGGVYGIDEYAEAFADTNKYTFGKADDVASQVYCGPFLLTKLQKDSEILVVKNQGYYKADTTTLNQIKWVFDNGENPTAFYEDTVKGIYAGCALGASNGLLEMAKADGNFDKYGYISDTTSTTYFGGINLNRGTFALESGACSTLKDEGQKIDTQLAVLNQNFRLALQYSFDKATYNAVSRGEDLKLTSLRNMYTMPEFVWLESEQTDENGHTFPAGTYYVDMVQYYVTELGMPIDVHDGVNGWYFPEQAKACLEKAKEELGDSVNWPVHIDWVYYSSNDVQINQAQAYKTVIENTLGAENVVVDLIEATTPEDFYACGYRASDGEAGCFDFFAGSGWGPDFGDPCTYLDTFLGDHAGYMTKVIGLF